MISGLRAGRRKLQYLGTTITLLDPTIVSPGDTIEIYFNYTIVNNGTSAVSNTAPWRIRLDATYYNDGIALLNGTNDYTIYPGEQLTFYEVHTITIPSDTVPGNHTIGVYTSSIIMWQPTGGTITSDGAVITVVDILPVDIDIKPGSYPNSINLGSNGVVPVAILSSETFDATQVDPETVELAGAGVAVRGKGNKYLAHEEDVNEDGLLDLVCQVETENLDPGTFQDGLAKLTGITYDGQEIEGWDEITIVPQ